MDVGAQVKLDHFPKHVLVRNSNESMSFPPSSLDACWPLVGFSILSMSSMKFSITLPRISSTTNLLTTSSSLFHPVSPTLCRVKQKHTNPRCFHKTGVSSANVADKKMTFAGDIRRFLTSRGPKHQNFTHTIRPPGFFSPWLSTFKTSSWSLYIV